MSSTRFVAPVVLLTLSSMVPSLALAQTSPTQAEPANAAASASAAAPAKPKVKLKGKTPLARGDEAMKLGELELALEQYQASLADKETPEALLALARCYDELKDYPNAVTHYEKFLSAVPRRMLTDGEAAKARSAAIQRMPGTVKVQSTPDGASVRIDGEEPVATPATFELAPGTHQLVFSAPEHDEERRELQVTFASSQELSVTLNETPKPPPAEEPVAEPTPEPEPPPPPVQPRSKLPAYITGGVAVAALGLGTAFGVRALVKKGDFNDNPTEATANSGENSALIADMAFGVALTFGITSAVLFFAKDEPRALASGKAGKNTQRAWRLTPTPYVNKHGGGAGAVVTF